MNAARAKSSLPGILGEIADLVGNDAAYAILDECGGRRIDIPAKAKRDHWLSDLVGFDVADKICRHFAVIDADGRRKGVRHELIPLGRTSMIRRAKRQLADAIREGKDVRSAAREVGLHERTGWRINKTLKGRVDDDGQGDLFNVPPNKPD